MSGYFDAQTEKEVPTSNTIGQGAVSLKIARLTQAAVRVRKQDAQLQETEQYDLLICESMRQFEPRYFFATTFLAIESRVDNLYIGFSKPR